MILTRRLINREAFLALFTVSVGGLATLVVGIPIIGYVLAPLIKQTPDVWRDVGPVDKYQVGTTVEVPFESNAPLLWAGTTALQAVWLRRLTGTDFIAYAVYCPHLGCPVHWIPGGLIFLCPCHGSVFNADGARLAGPAPRGLFTYQTRVVNGRVQIKTHPLPVAT
jgi:menaquinol-cytochrome c reductase iron-sulfur subunit